MARGAPELELHVGRVVELLCDRDERVRDLALEVLTSACGPSERKAHMAQIGEMMRKVDPNARVFASAFFYFLTPRSMPTASTEGSVPDLTAPKAAHRREPFRCRPSDPRHPPWRSPVGMLRENDPRSGQ